MGMIADLFVKLGLKSEEFNKGLDTAKQKTNSFGDGIKKIGGIIAGAFAVGAIINFAKSSVLAYDESEKAATRLLTALKGNKEITQSLIQLAAEKQKTTLFEDDETINAMSLVAAFVKEEIQIKKLIPLIQDFASAKSIDLASAANIVGKSIGSSTNALGRYGVEISGAAGSTQRFESAMSGLSARFEGQASALAKVGLGPLKILENAWEDVKEKIGGAIVESEAFKRAVSNITIFVNSDGLDNAIKSFSDFAYIFSRPDAEAMSFWQSFTALLRVTGEAGSRRIAADMVKLARLKTSLGLTATLEEEKAYANTAKRAKADADVEFLMLIRNAKKKEDFISILDKEQSKLSTLKVPFGVRSTGADEFMKQGEKVMKLKELIQNWKPSSKDNTVTKALTDAEVYKLRLENLTTAATDAKKALEMATPTSDIVKLGKDYDDATKSLKDFIEQTNTAKFDQLTLNYNNAIEAMNKPMGGRSLTELSTSLEKAKFKLEEFVKASSDKDLKKKFYDEQIKGIDSYVNEQGNILKENYISGVQNKEEYEVEMLRLSITGYEMDKAEALKYGQDITKIDAQILDARLRLKESGLELMKGKTVISAEYNPVTGKDKQGNISKDELRVPAAMSEGNSALIAGMEREQAAFVDFKNNFNQLIASGMAELTTTFGEGIGALMSGDMNIGEFGQNLLATIGRFMVQFGQLLIAYAIAASGLEEAIKTPGAWPIALAAGIALVAIGSSLSKMGKSGVGGPSTGGGSAASGYAFSTGQSSASNAWNGNVVFELHGNTLQGVLNNQDRRNKQFK
jgi:hypothetical protein